MHVAFTDTVQSIGAAGLNPMSTNDRYTSVP